MTADELGPIIEQYQAGVEAEVTLFHQLTDVARRQYETSLAGDFTAFHLAGDERDDLMRRIMALETSVGGLRKTLETHRPVASTLETFAAVTARHREASTLVAQIIATDRESLAALANADLARRSAAAGLERSENTLAAYRRVLAPPNSGASLVDRVG